MTTKCCLFKSIIAMQESEENDGYQARWKPRCTVYYDKMLCVLS